MLPSESVALTDKIPFSNIFFTSILSPSFDAANKAVNKHLINSHAMLSTLKLKLQQSILDPKTLFWMENMNFYDISFLHNSNILGLTKTLHLKLLHTKILEYGMSLFLMI